jgi:hypothetical protein
MEWKVLMEEGEEGGSERPGGWGKGWRGRSGEDGDGSGWDGVESADGGGRGGVAERMGRGRRKQEGWETRRMGKGRRGGSREDGDGSG